MDTKFAELIRDIQHELIRSQKMRMYEQLPPLFKVKSLTLELQFTVEEMKDLNGKLGIKIVEAGAAKNRSQSSVHKMIIQLDAIDDPENIESDDLKIPLEKIYGYSPSA